MCSEECCPPVRPDEATAERAALVERITDALVQFDREQHEGYGAHGPFSDRLARIVRVNDANHAAWAVLQYYAELRRAATDELSALGQEMRLDEPIPATFCAHHGDDSYFDRTLCAPPCDVMHTRCRECHRPLEPCAHSVRTCGCGRHTLAPDEQAVKRDDVWHRMSGCSPEDDPRPYNACWGPDVTARAVYPWGTPPESGTYTVSTRTNDAVPYTRQTLERLAKHLCERYDANSLTWEAADKQDRGHWRHEASLVLDVVGGED